MKRIYHIIIAIGLSVVGQSCQKYLDKSPDVKLAIPSTLGDLKLLLDNYRVMNTQFPSSMEIQSDNYYVTATEWQAVSDERIRNQYLWQKAESIYWAPMYTAILHANIVIDGLKDIKYQSSEQQQFNTIYGSALFFRSYYYYLCAQSYGIPYDRNSASRDLGIVLRKSSSFEEQSKRATNLETYQEIVKGFELAIQLLPKLQEHKTQPTKAAAYGALARTYLAMQDYVKSGQYADSCIVLYGKDKLLDFNNPDDISIDAPAPIKTFNHEVIFHFVGPSNEILTTNMAKIDSLLIQQYDNNDLRKTVFFQENSGENRKTYSLKGGYDGSLGGTNPNVFGGIALDEMLLIRAESAARAGKIKEAIDDLNFLLQHRWKTGMFTPLSASNSNDALKLVLFERRKELIYRGTRWVALRRLMKEPTLSITPKRILGNNSSELLPNSSGYALQIPMDVIHLSNIQQNP